MKFDITWTITAVIAVSSFLSPIFVAIINNRHHAKIRKMELEHDEYMHQLNLNQQSIVKQFDVYYADKKEAFSEFANTAGIFSMGKGSQRDYENLHSAIDKCMIFCNSENNQLLCDFQNYIDIQVFGGGYSPSERSEYSKRLNSVVLSLNKELQSTKPVIQSERREH